MEQRQPHQLRLARMHASGAEEWLCPTCGRHLLLRWQPAYQKQVIAAGDPAALHSAGRAGQPGRMPTGAPPQTYRHASHPGADTADIGGDWSAEGLQPWLRWFQQAQLDELWNQPL